MRVLWRLEMEADKRSIVLILCLVVLGCAVDEPGAPEPTAVSSEGARHVAVSYSPTGTQMSYWAPVSEGAGGWQLWVADSDLSAARALPVTAAESPPPAAWSPDGTRLAALSNDFGASDIVVLTTAGGAPRRLTDSPGYVIPQFWHPDGERFTYSVRTEDGVMRTFAVSAETGATARVLPEETRDHIAVVSPDGSRIAYNVLGPEYTIWVAGSAGENPRQLSTGGADFFPPWLNPWSPDGTEVLYQSRVGGTFDIWVAPVDGTTPRQLTTDEADDHRGAWSPDGKWIVFISRRDAREDLWVVPSAGGTEHRVTDTPQDIYGGALWRPGPSPSVAFVSHAQEGRVWALDLADGGERPITPDSVDVAAFDLSTGGRELVFVMSKESDVREMATMPVRGGQIRRLVSVQGTLEDPLWSPDDSMILFRSDQVGSPDVWVVNAADGSARQVAAWPSNEGRYAWSGSGEVVFASDRDARLSDLWRADPAGGEPVRITTHGGVERPVLRGGLDPIYVSATEPQARDGVLARVLPDGALETVWDRSISSPRALSPTGIWVAAVVVEPAGLTRGILLSTTDGGPEVLLGVVEEPLAWSPDGTQTPYTVRAEAAADLAILMVADGTVRRLTVTPEDESSATFLPDGSAVVFRRERTVQRIFTMTLERVKEGSGRAGSEP
jgi:Tol biopolymer transport system component